MQGMGVVPIFAGFDVRRSIGRLWAYDMLGGRYGESMSQQAPGRFMHQQ